MAVVGFHLEKNSVQKCSLFMPKRIRSQSLWPSSVGMEPEGSLAETSSGFGTPEHPRPTSLLLHVFQPCCGPPSGV